MIICQCNTVSVSFRSCVFSYWTQDSYTNVGPGASKFPSPFGVVSFLIRVKNLHEEIFETLEFPSPFGVMSFLIYKRLLFVNAVAYSVSVSFRSCVFSYFLIFGFLIFF